MNPAEPADQAGDLFDGDGRSLRGEYERLGPDAYYRLHGHAYRNPHEADIDHLLKRAVGWWEPDLGSVLDLAAGSGEATLSLRRLGAPAVTGIDPFTHEAYHRRTGQTAERWTFEQIAGGSLGGRRWTLIVCSFALHLCEPSRLPGLATQLALAAPELWILTPHKRPVLEPQWGWSLVDERVERRVRIRRHRSTLFA